MAKYGHIRLRTEINAISAHIADVTALIKEMHMALNNDPRYYNWQTYNVPPWEEDEERFDPESVDWEQLIELYRDDPALTFIFGQLEEYFKRQVPGFRSDKYIRWSDSSGTSPLSGTAVGSGTSTAGLYLYGDTTTPMKISDSFTVRYDTNGTYTLTKSDE